MKKKWEIKNNIQDQGSRIDQIMKALLKNRGLVNKKQINEFLNPPDPYILDPVSLGIKKKELGKAIRRIKKAIVNKEKIVIYGDYDADGISATAILWETLHALKAKVMPFIPHRQRHGYGLKKEGIDEIIAKFNPQLIITVDNGIVAKKGVNYANQKKIDVIITDHHQPPKTLPKALAIIWSDQVAGTGVAWFLAKEVYHYFHKNLLGFKASNSLELACLGTITDQMPALGVNRSLIKYGLKELRKSKRPGIMALCAEAGIRQKEIRTYEIGFIIGPRLNAMGRLEDALESLRLLCTRSSERADGLAAKLGLTNRQRQQLSQTTFEHAQKTAKAQFKKANLLFVSHKSYNQGIIGLVAGKLVEEFYRPAIVISQEKDFSKGSSRSIEGFNIFKALNKFTSLFKDIGGHPMAAGFTVETKNLKTLKQKLVKLAAKEIKAKLLEPKVKVDLELDLGDISWHLFKEIEKFAPFGLNNPRPVFVIKKIGVAEIRLVGRERKHLKLKLAPSFEAIAFNLGHLAKKISLGDEIDICFMLDKNVWNNKKTLQFNIKDIKGFH